MTQPFRLVQIAAEAEKLRLRSVLTRLATRIELVVIAFVFLVGTVAFVHVIAWHWLRIDDHSVFATAGILAGADLAIAIMLGLLAGLSRPSRVEREAPLLRRRAIQTLETELNTFRPLPLIRRLTRRSRQG